MRLSTIELKLVCSCFSSLSTSGIKLSCSKSKHYIQKSMAVTLSQEWLLTKAYRYIFIPEDMTHMSDDDDYDFAGIIDWMSGWVIRIREWFSLPTFVVTSSPFNRLTFNCGISVPNIHTTTFSESILHLSYSLVLLCSTKGFQVLLMIKAARLAWAGATKGGRGGSWFGFVQGQAMDNGYAFKRG